jgi:hypothetical protein
MTGRDLSLDKSLPVWGKISRKNRQKFLMAMVVNPNALKGSTFPPASVLLRQKGGVHYLGVGETRKRRRILLCTCAGPSSEGLKEVRRTVKLVFQFQNKAWVFKGVLSTDNRPTTLSIVFDKPPKGWDNVEDNNFWKELIK